MNYTPSKLTNKAIYFSRVCVVALFSSLSCFIGLGKHEGGARVRMLVAW
jgi:hypothetical protein